MRNLAITIQPFRWRMPRVDRAVCETVVFVGCLRLSWDV